MTEKTDEKTQLPVKRELAAGAPLRAIIPTTVEDAYRIATAVVKADLAPTNMKTPEKCLIAIMHGLEIGVPPMQAIQSIAIVNGRPAVYGDLAMALVRGSGLCDSVREHIEGEGDEMVAHCIVRRKDETRTIKSTFSVQDAIVAKLWKKDGPWQTHPKRMLQMRARGFALRDAFADVLRGLYLREELEGEENLRDITPPPATKPNSIQGMLDRFTADEATAEAGIMENKVEIIPPKVET